VASELRLKVAASTIDGKGIAKLDSDSFRALRLSDGQLVIVTYGAKSVEFAARQDNIFSESTARLMKADMSALHVEPGMMVTVSKKDCSRPAMGTAPNGEKKGRKSRKAKAASLDRF
jgi:hypothetical protein